MVFMTENEGASIQAEIQDNEQCFSTLLESILQWSKWERMGSILTWVNCIGVLLHTWNIHYFIMVISTIKTRIKSL